MSETAATVSDIHRTAMLQAGFMSPFTVAPRAAGVEYGGQSNAQALGLAAGQNPQLFALQPTRVLEPPAGSKIKGYLDDFSARIEMPGQASDIIAQSLS